MMTLAVVLVIVVVIIAVMIIATLLFCRWKKKRYGVVFLNYLSVGGSMAKWFGCWS